MGGSPHGNMPKNAGTAALKSASLKFRHVIMFPYGRGKNPLIPSARLTETCQMKNIT